MPSSESKQEREDWEAEPLLPSYTKDSQDATAVKPPAKSCCGFVGRRKRIRESSDHFESAKSEPKQRKATESMLLEAKSLLLKVGVARSLLKVMSQGLRSGSRDA